MTYLLNVAKRYNIGTQVGYKFYFRIKEEHDQHKLAEIEKELKTIYPEPEYKYDRTVWIKRGHSVDDFKEINWSNIL